MRLLWPTRLRSLSDYPPRSLFLCTQTEKYDMIKWQKTQKRSSREERSKVILNKRVFAAVCLCLLMGHSALAQSVVVEGVGLDRDSAIRDAARAAVEQVAGTYIDSRTLVESSAVALDEIYSHAQGFARDITVLEEHPGAEYRVRVRADVDTDPNTPFMKRLDMVMRLNDPRLGVVILQEADENASIFQTDGADERRNGHDTILETALNERLLAVGFSHVVDVGLVSQLQDSALLNGIYRGDSRLAGAGETERPIDYLIVGKSRSDSYKVSLPNGRGGYETSPISSARTELDLKILDFSTGNLLATFSLEGQGVENSPELAKRKARQAVAAQAAEKLEAQFHKVAARPFEGIRMTVRAADLQDVNELVAELKRLRGVQDVYMRGTADGKTVLELASAQKPYVLLQMLQNETKFKLFVENVSASELSVVIR